MIFPSVITQKYHIPKISKYDKKSQTSTTLTGNESGGRGLAVRGLMISPNERLSDRGLFLLLIVMDNALILPVFSVICDYSCTWFESAQNQKKIKCVGESQTIPKQTSWGE